jgi:hypothetical protein
VQRNDEPEESRDRATGYRRHNTQPYGSAMWHAMAACRAAVGTYILSHRPDSQTAFARRASLSVPQLRSIEYGQQVEYSDLKAVTEAIAGDIGADAAWELRQLYRALSRCISRFENSDIDEGDADG